MHAHILSIHTPLHCGLGLKKMNVVILHIKLYGNRYRPI